MDRKLMIIIGVTVVLVILIIIGTAAVITYNSTGSNTTNTTTVNTTNNTTVNATNNTTNSNNTNSTSSKSSSKKSKNSESSDDVHSIYEGSDKYHYSAQYGGYIKEWRDSNGNYHLRGCDGVLREDYNTHTGEFKGNSKEYGYEHYYMNPGA